MALLEIPIKERIVDGFTIGKRNDAKIAGLATLRILDAEPVPDAAIRLHFPPQRVFDCCEAPPAFNIGTLSQHLLLEIARGFHDMDL